MILRPRLKDIGIVGFYLGRISIGLGVLMLLPAILGLFLFREIDPSLDFVIAAQLTLLFGMILSWGCATREDLNMIQGMVVVSLSWLTSMIFGALPLYLSGHFTSFLDACFEAMSGFTTTGLSLVQDLDHLSYTHNLWRHMGPFIGGQGIAIVALSLFMGGSSGAFNMYLAEARDEKILPNVIHTSRFIWFISIGYLILGTIMLGITGVSAGMRPFNAFFHGACIFMAGFDTAGFAPQSQNVLYYHSAAFEIMTTVFMILGSFNFNLHYQLWKGNYRELWKNIELRTFLLSVVLTFLIVAVGLNRLQVYPDGLLLFRKGFFQAISGHTTTGYMTIYAKQFIKEWGDLALSGMIILMALGGSVCSTAGGIKMLRLGIIFKAFLAELKTMLLFDRAVVVQKFHHIKTVVLEDKQVRGVLLVTFGYGVLYCAGTLMGLACGYPFLESLFESTSAAANVGLSCGVTDAGMPVLLKITYIVQMWAGRLELMSVFALVGFSIALIKGR